MARTSAQRPDRRLLATCYVPPSRTSRRSRANSRAAIDAGARRLLLVRRAVPAATSRPTRFSRSGSRRSERPRLVFHVGGGLRAADDRLLDAHYFANGCPPVPDFHGGDENFPLVSIMANRRAYAAYRHSANSLSSLNPHLPLSFLSRLFNIIL
jgi:hypothetical protein